MRLATGTALSAAVALIQVMSIQAQQRPNDPLFNRQISLSSRGGTARFDEYSWRESPVEFKTVAGIDLNILDAWEISTGSRDVIVALIDDGFPYWHEDVRENVWHNQGEMGIDDAGYPKDSNGIDDDNNGYIDDVIGYDFAFSDPDPDPYIFDGRRDDRIAIYTHSCSAMGIIGASGNNGIGIAGINWEVSMMLLKIGAQGTAIDPDGLRRVEWAAEAIRYAVDNGARAINWSGNVRPTEPGQVAPLLDAIAYAQEAGVLLIVAAGNSKKDVDLPENLEYPRNAEAENVVVVAEIDFDGSLYVVPEDSRYVGGSDFGRRTVDIAALGQNYTTFIRRNVSAYYLGGGTSDASPVVTGVAALIWSIRPDLSGSDVKKIIIQSARRSSALSGRMVSGGTVDAAGALRLAREWDGGR